MKYFLHIALIAFGLSILSACGGSKTDGATADSSAPADSVSPTALADTVPADTVPLYLSDDLRRFNLHGAVKSVTTKDYSRFVTCLSGPLNFDAEGRLTSTFSDFLDNEISYSRDGFIDETECRESDGTTFELEFTNFDEAGNPISGKYESEGPDQEWKVTFTIVYTDFDRENNWTRRSFKGEATTRVMTASGDYGRPQREPFAATESRVIVYY